MARLPRIQLPDIPLHIIQRGNNRSLCFADTQDFIAYTHWLTEYSVKHYVDIHAWVFMTNHVHLLCTPRKPNAISLLMQSLGRRYVQYFNYKYGRTGTLWEGRFKSCIIECDLYLLQVYKYIELNPVRANIVNDPSDYVWSSYQINALGKQSALCTCHPTYLDLGSSAIERQEIYRSLFNNHIEGKIIEDIRLSLNKGLALGSERFKSQIEHVTGRRVKSAKLGRPLGPVKTQAI